MSQNITLNSDNTLTVLARDSVSGADLSGATVTYSLADSDGAVDSGVCAYVDTTTVDSVTYYRFRGTVADTVSLTQGATYTATVTVNAGAGLQREIVETLTGALG